MQEIKPTEKPAALTRISESMRTTTTGSAPASRVSFSAASNNGASTKPPATAMQVYSMPTLNCSENINDGARKNGMKLKSIENSMVAKFSLKDRIIHILALKPLKKIELLTQLEKQGATDRDRMEYASVCREVAQRNSTTNEYILSREFYTKLKPDWPLYTDENRAVIRSLLEKLETSPVGSASNTPDLSPCPSTNSESPIGSRQPKMPGPSIDEVNYTLPASKKQRIAHAQPPSAQQPSTQLPLQQSQTAQQPLPQPLQQQPKELPKKEVRTKSAPNKNSSVSVQPKVPGTIKSMQQSQQQPAQQPAPQPLPQHPKELPEMKVCTKSAPNKNSSVSVPPKVPDAIKSMPQSQQQPAQQPPPQPLTQHPKELPKKKVRTESAPNKNSSVSVQPKVPGSIKSMNKQDNRGVSNDAAPSAMNESCQENVNNVSVPLSSDDYLRKYMMIWTDEQRNSYKKDFDAEYDEYKMLSEKTSDRTKIFRDLNAKMKSTDDIDEYEHFRNEIISEYDKLKCDTKYVEQKVRCTHLHVKLAHIRQLVTDYDQL